MRRFLFFTIWIMLGILLFMYSFAEHFGYALNIVDWIVVVVGVVTATSIAGCYFEVQPSWRARAIDGARIGYALLFLMTLAIIAANSRGDGWDSLWRLDIALLAVLGAGWLVWASAVRKRS